MIQASTTPAVPPTVSRFETSYEDLRPVDRTAFFTSATRWGAIVAGAFAAISMQVIFALLGTAIGLSVIGLSNDAPEQGLSVGAGIWWLVTGLISLFFGGWIAGRLSASADRNVGVMHGFLAWCTVTVLSVVLLTMAGGSALGGSLGVVGGAMAANNSPVQRPMVNDRSSGPIENSSNVNSPVTEAEQKEAAKAAAGASWWTLFALVLGATVASIGGRVGVRDYDYDRETRSAADR